MKTVVIVDDREDNRALLLATLEHRDYRLVEASRGEEALKLIGKEEPDLIIADVLMPRMDGYEFVQQLRQVARNAQMNVILQTVVENLDEGVIVSDLKGGLVQWNRAALAIHGYTNLEEGLRSQSDLVDTFELSTLDGTRVPLEEWPLFRILRGENLRDLELRVRNIRADWERIFNYGGTLVHDGSNEPLLAIVTVSDITQRKRAEERLREQADIINHAREAIII